MTGVKGSSSAYLSRVRGTSPAYLTGVWGYREVKINCVFVYFSLDKPLLGVSLFLGHFLDFKLSYEKIFLGATFLFKDILNNDKANSDS
jgi:hypothetical protein